MTLYFLEIHGNLNTFLKKKSGVLWYSGPLLSYLTKAFPRPLPRKHFFSSEGSFVHLSCKHSHIPFHTRTFFIVPWPREAAQNSSAISSHQVSSGPKSDVFPPLPLLSSIVKTVCPGSTCVSLKDKTNDQILVCVLWGTQHLWCHSCLFYPSRFNHDIPPSCHCTLKTPGELHHARKGHLQALGDRNSRKTAADGNWAEWRGLNNWTAEQLNGR